MMSNDLLPLPDILAEPPKEAGRAAVVAPAAVERNGHSLREYPSGNSHPGTNGLAGAIDLLNIAHGDSPVEEPGRSTDGLADVAMTVRQIESILQANGTLAPEVHFAVERIHDVAMALRMREVDAALCDSLEASIREVGDAIVRNDAAAARSLSAAALLCDLSQRIDQMMPHAAFAAPVPASAERSAGVQTFNGESAGLNGVSPRPLAHAIDVAVSDEDHARSLLQPGFVHPALPEMQAAAEAKENAAKPAATLALSMPSPMDGSPLDGRNEAVRANGQDADAPADALIAVETVGSASGAAQVVQATPPAAPPSPPPAEMKVAAPANSRAAPNDPLAALHSLSEEELIALFS